MNYAPQPMDTTRVTLPPGIRDLTEAIAKHAHEVWARQRMRDGWTYGPRRDDVGKKHPGLVPYEQLSEAEKEYDRQTALESIKAILALGYQILPPS